MRSPWVRVQTLVFVILMGSYAYFWQARDWNTASRLMLTYAMVDRGTVCLDGLDRQTGDIARYRGHYYGDKLPGYSMAAAAPYAAARGMFGFPPHPRNVEAIKYWPADFWVTLGTSGLCTALTAVLLMGLVRDLGGSPGRAAMVGLAYGLATPAYVYATLAYGHQVSAFCLFAAFCLLRKAAVRGDRWRMAAAGFLAAFAAVVELQVGPVSAILGIDLLVQCLTGRRPRNSLLHFAVGALVPTLILLCYNLLAFGSPWEMGYFHHATAQFARVHSRENPLGLRGPDLRRVVPLLWGEHRGLLFYAPILVLAVPGWVLMAARAVLFWLDDGPCGRFGPSNHPPVSPLRKGGKRRLAAWLSPPCKGGERRGSGGTGFCASVNCSEGKRGAAMVSVAAAAAVFVVNLSYPEWTGGWSTGPRLLVPLLPFAMVPVADFLSLAPGRGRGIAGLALLLACWGGVLMLLFQGVGARIPQDIARPLQDFVWPLWTGRMSAPGWWSTERFTRNLAATLAPGWVGALPEARQGMQFLPLVLAQLAVIAGLAAAVGWRGSTPPRDSASNLGIDEQEERGGADEHSKNPEAKPDRAEPDLGP